MGRYEEEPIDRDLEKNREEEFQSRQRAFKQDIERWVLDSRARKREIDAKEQELTDIDATESSKSLADQIWHQRQRLLSLLRTSDLDTAREVWFRQLSSENWRTELNFLIDEATSYLNIRLIDGSEESVPEIHNELLNLDSLVSLEQKQAE